MSPLVAGTTAAATPRVARTRRAVRSRPGTAAVRRGAVEREGWTLEDMISGVWEDLSAHSTTGCPVCGAAMTPRCGSGPGVLAGQCTGCSARLA